MTHREFHFHSLSSSSEKLRFDEHDNDHLRPSNPLDNTPTHAKMGRMHSNGKGISSSALPYSRTPPAWLKTTPEQVVDQICKLAKKGAAPSQIGVVLRDSHGVAQVKVVTGKRSPRNHVEQELSY